MPRLLTLFSLFTLLALWPGDLSSKASAQTDDAPDARTAALQLSDLPAGFMLADEEAGRDRGLATYAATWVQRDSAQLAKDGLLVVISEDLISVGGTDGAGPEVVQALARAWVNAMSRRSRFPVDGDPQLVAGPRVGDDSQWISAQVPIGPRSAPAYALAFRAGRFFGVVEGIFVEGVAGKPIVFRLAEVVRSRLASLQGIDAPPLLMRDDFTGPGDGPVSCAASGVAAGFFTIGYSGGECAVKPLTPNNTTTYLPTSTELGDTSASVNVRLLGNSAGYQVGMSCRDQVQGGVRTPGYQLLVRPTDGTFTFKAFNKPSPAPNLPGSAIITVAEGASSAIHGGADPNRLGLVCAGTSISASVNGVPLASVQDDQTAVGSMSLWLATTGTEGEVRFRDLTVAQP
jgi:hypothetical protein